MPRASHESALYNAHNVAWPLPTALKDGMYPCDCNAVSVSGPFLNEVRAWSTLRISWGEMRGANIGEGMVCQQLGVEDSTTGSTCSS